MWYPGVDGTSVYRFGFVPANTVLQYRKAVAAFPHSTGFATTTIDALHISTLTFRRRVPIVYRASATGNGQVAFSPDISSSFHKTRTFSGIVTVKATTAHVQGALGAGIRVNGSLTAGSIGDTRQVYSHFDSRSGHLVSFDDDTITQSTAIKKDMQKGIAASRGVALLCGPDIPQNMSAPSSRVRQYEDGMMYDLDMIALAGGALPYDITNANLIPPISPATTYHIYSYFITPFDIELDPGIDARSGVTTFRHVMPEVCDPLGHFDFTLRIRLGPYALGGVNDTFMQYFINPVAVHYFGHANPNGTCEWYSYRESGGAVSGFGQGESFTAHFRPGAYRRGVVYDVSNDQRSHHGFAHVPQGATYLGSHLFGELTQFYPMADPTSRVAPVEGVHLTVVNKMCFADGHTGPARIVRYDELQQFSRMQVNAVVHVQGVPVGSVSPFVDSVTGSDAEMNITVYARLGRLFASTDSALRRVWDLREYVEYIKKGQPSDATIALWFGESESAKAERQKKRLKSSDVGGEWINQDALPWGTPQMKEIWAKMDLHLMNTRDKPLYLGSLFQMQNR
jgi:hypothetical protein